MSGSDLIWGIVLIVCGIFVSVYGNVLFRYVLTVVGFAAGFGVAMALSTGQDLAMRILISLVAGAILGAVLYSLFSLALYIAGGLLGAVIALVISALVGFLDQGTGIGAIILLLVGTGLVGFFGPRLGSLIVILGTAATGAYLTVDGLTVLFNDQLPSDIKDPGTVLNQRLALTVFLIIMAMSALSQINASKLRFRFLRR